MQSPVDNSITTFHMYTPDHSPDSNFVMIQRNCLNTLLVNPWRKLL